MKGADEVHENNRVSQTIYFLENFFAGKKLE
jgi:hypothetical protein